MEFYKVQLRNWSLIQYVPLFALCPKMETWILLDRLQPLLFDYFVLLAAAGWYRLMPSGGSFCLEEKTCNFWKLWYNHDTLGWDEVSSLGWRKQPDLCFWPMLEPGQEITGRGRKNLGTGGWLENREWKTFWKPGQRNPRKSESKVVLNVSLVQIRRWKLPVWLTHSKTTFLTHVLTHTGSARNGRGRFQWIAEGGKLREKALKWRLFAEKVM